MYETVKEVKGYAITRLAGCTGGPYYVTLKTFAHGGRKCVVFKTIKAAAAYIEQNL